MTVEHPLDGTPAARFTQLLSELDKRFPDKRPFSAEPVEGRYLGAIDRLIAKTSDRLVHQVKLDDWAHVVRVMKEYKKKIHARYKDEHGFSAGIGAIMGKSI